MTTTAATPACPPPFLRRSLTQMKTGRRPRPPVFQKTRESAMSAAHGDTLGPARGLGVVIQRILCSEGDDSVMDDVPIERREMLMQATVKISGNAGRGGMEQVALKKRQFRVRVSADGVVREPVVISQSFFVPEEELKVFLPNGDCVLSDRYLVDIWFNAKVSDSWPMAGVTRGESSRYALVARNIDAFHHGMAEKRLESYEYVGRITYTDYKLDIGIGWTMPVGLPVGNPGWKEVNVIGVRPKPVIVPLKTKHKGNRAALTRRISDKEPGVLGKIHPPPSTAGSVTDLLTRPASVVGSKMLSSMSALAPPIQIPAWKAVNTGLSSKIPFMPPELRGTATLDQPLQTALIVELPRLTSTAAPLGQSLPLSPLDVPRPPRLPVSESVHGIGGPSVNGSPTNSEIPPAEIVTALKAREPSNLSALKPRLQASLAEGEILQVTEPANPLVPLATQHKYGNSDTNLNPPPNITPLPRKPLSTSRPTSRPISPKIAVEPLSAQKRRSLTSIVSNLPFIPSTPTAPNFLTNTTSRLVTGIQSLVSPKRDDPCSGPSGASGSPALKPISIKLPPKSTLQPEIPASNEADDLGDDLEKIDLVPKVATITEMQTSRGRPIKKPATYNWRTLRRKNMALDSKPRRKPGRKPKRVTGDSGVNRIRYTDPDLGTSVFLADYKCWLCRARHNTEDDLLGHIRESHGNFIVSASHEEGDKEGKEAGFLDLYIRVKSRLPPWDGEVTHDPYPPLPPLPTEIYIPPYMTTLYDHITHMPILPNTTYVIPPYNPSFLISRHESILSDYTDINGSERAYITAWTSHALAAQPTRATVGAIWSNFVFSNLEWLCSEEELIDHVMVHAMAITMCDVIGIETHAGVMRIIQEELDKREREGRPPNKVWKDKVIDMMKCGVCKEVAKGDMWEVRCAECEGVFHGICLESARGRRDPVVGRGPFIRGWKCGGCSGGKHKDYINI